MQKPILKIQWERAKAHIILDRMQTQNIVSPWKAEEIESFHLLSEGCANTNYKITFKKDIQPVVLRIYIRDKEALWREQAIHHLLKNVLPAPDFLYSNDSCNQIGYAYALIEWVEGAPMREIILQGNTESISQCSYDAGKALSKLMKIKFEKSGFFHTDLSIKPFGQEENFLPFALNCLQEKQVQESLKISTVDNLKSIFIEHADLFPYNNKANLTHADFDPSNMLVKKVNGTWSLSAILDWEFAFAGSYLMDIGLMLRYAHKLPSCYESSFIAGIEESGHELPKNWKKSAKLLDLICLLNLLQFNPAHLRPKMTEDIKSLIENTISYF